MHSKRNPQLGAKIKQLALHLAPLVSLSSGQVHPSFPNTLLNYWLLTSDELDDLAHFYHQRSPNHWTSFYPCPVYWRKEASLEEKRRRIGRFIGLRGCESPIIVQTEQDIMEDVRRAREQAAEKEALKGKARWY